MKTIINRTIAGLLAFATASACAPTQDSADSTDIASAKPASDRANRNIVAPFGQDAKRRLSDPRAKNSLVMKIGSVPGRLTGLSLTEPAWLQWIQERLGDSVKVASLREAGRAPNRSKTVVVTIGLESDENVLEAVARANKDDNVEWAEAELIWKSTASVSDPGVDEQWYLNRIAAPSAWDTTFGSSDVVVAVIDTGIEFVHDDLLGAVWQNADETPDDNLDNDRNGFVDDVNGWDFVSAPAEDVMAGEDPGPGDNDPSDFHGHGTAMSGVIGARADGSGIVGVAPGVRIMPVRAGFADPYGYGSFKTGDIADAIEYAVKNGAQVINMSFGGYTPAAIVKDAVDYAASKGVILVASAGNDSTDTPTFPAAYQNVLAVAAMDENDERGIFNSGEASNWGSWVDISAPGVGIYTTTVGNSFSSVSGTSPAAAVVSGIAALARSANPNLDFTEMRGHLLSSVDGALANDDISRQPIFGAGLAFAATAVAPPSAGSKAYRLPVIIKEQWGNGDQELDADETATITASWHITTARPGLTGRLTSQDAYIRLIVDTVPLHVSQDSTATATFGIAVNSDVPADHTAEMTIELIDDLGQVLETPVRVELARTFRPSALLPPSGRQVMLPLSAGRDMLVMDSGWRNNYKSVFATIRYPNGAFSPMESLSDPDHEAKRPSAAVGPDGDIHISFDQYITPPESDANIAFVAYARYDVDTETWSSSEFVAIENGINRQDPDDYSAIGFDSDGRLHIAWPRWTGIQAVRQENDGTWSAAEEIFTFDEVLATARIDLLTVNGALKMFVQAGTAPLARKPVLVLEYDGTHWSAPVATTPVTAVDTVGRPFLFNGEVYHFFTVAEGAPTYLAKLNMNDMQWYFQRAVTTFTGAVFGKESASIMMGTDTAVTYSVFDDRPSDREGTLVFDTLNDTATLNVPGNELWVSKYPTLHADRYGNMHLFTVEYNVADNNKAMVTTYTSNAAFNGDAVPSVPVVSDDGAVTANASLLAASWSSVYSLGTPIYRIAWGTAPGTDDIVPWQETEETSLTFDIRPRKLLPEQVVYATVVADSGAMYESAMGFSNGIRYNPCDAALWRSDIVYREQGMRVTYNGAVYENKYWNSFVPPGGANGPWNFVKSCSGDPVLPPCFAPEWDPNEAYRYGDVVGYQGVEFEALWATAGVTPTGNNGNPWGWVADCIPE